MVVELSPCYPGFVYEPVLLKCICFSDSDHIVSCSGSTSTIKRGYWFGIVDGETTVAVCPNEYCNFAFCEAANGYYLLSPKRINQCSLCRSGIACGSCKEGYTLSYDPADCISFNKCTAGWTVLAVTLSMLYWLALVVSLRVSVGIGYLYAITYYYSMLAFCWGSICILHKNYIQLLALHLVLLK